MQEDIKLIKRAQNGDTAAFEELIYKYDRQVLNIAASFRNNTEDAKDIYQEVFLKVYKGLKNFQFKSEFSTWLYRITANVCITNKSKQERHNTDSLDRQYGSEEDSATLGDSIAGDSSTDKQAVSSDLAEHIKKAVEKLPPQQKLALTLKYYQGFKIKEIAEMLNCAEGTVKRYLFTAANKLREDLKYILES